MVDTMGSMVRVTPTILMAISPTIRQGSDVGKMGKLEDDSWGDWLHLLSGQPCRLRVRMGNDYERKRNVLVPVLVGISLFSEWNC
jgi:hypothetical protein